MLSLSWLCLMLSRSLTLSLFRPLDSSSPPFSLMPSRSCSFSWSISPTVVTVHWLTVALTCLTTDVIKLRGKAKDIPTSLDHQPWFTRVHNAMSTDPISRKTWSREPFNFKVFETQFDLGNGWAEHFKLVLFDCRQELEFYNINIIQLAVDKIRHRI